MRKNFIALLRETMDHTELTPDRAQALLWRILNKLSAAPCDAGKSNGEKENANR